MFLQQCAQTATAQAEMFVQFANIKDTQLNNVLISGEDITLQPRPSKMCSIRALKSILESIVQFVRVVDISLKIVVSLTKQFLA